ncbi:hypothetical protein LCGC14_3031900 [marine sediment metagenome]|uniref:Uncharacterized protein n=1 Tax=marine sediment metagenome TaxID=412755 RepID=A0A0F8XFB9_9ZZZZ
MDYNEYCDLLDGATIVVNTNGHAVRTDTREFRMTLMLQGWETDLEFPIVKESSYSFQCGKCGKRPTVTIYEDHIEFEDNHVEPEAFSVDIEFPSGEMLFNDTYPDCFDCGDFDVNTVAGVQECSEYMAKQGMMHFFVGNSCPAVWKEGEVIFVGCIPDDDCGTRVGSICTDLWWASFVDPTIVTRRSINIQGLENPDSDPQKEIAHMKDKGGSIKVTPGTYRCTSYYHLGDMDYGGDEKQVFCKLERIQ